MKLKEFLKPDWRKLLIFLILVSLITIIFQSSMVGGWTEYKYYFVLPLTSITHKIVYCAYAGCVPESSFDINYPFLALNLVFWYIISCLIIEIYYKYLKKVKRK